VRMLADTDSKTRTEAMETLIELELEPSAFASHASTIVIMLTDSNFAVSLRLCVAMAFRRLDQSALTPHVDAIAGMLTDSHYMMRDAAVLALGQLEPATLTSHAGAIVSMIADPTSTVRRSAVNAFSKLNQSALTPHAGAVVGMLANADPMIRHAALMALDKLEPSALTYSAATNMLNDAEFEVRYAAKNARIKIKRRRARLNWATAAQAYIVRPYALFWYEFVGKQLCAPGGKWAENDRAAFEEEFDELCH